MFAVAVLQDDLEAASRLMIESLGRGSFAPEALRALAAEPHGRLFAARDQAGALLGVAHARLLPRERMSFYRAFGGAVQLLEQKRVGSLFVSAVAVSARGQGVGTALARARLAWLSERGCNYAIGISWQSGLAHTSRPIFERLGFEIMGVSNDFFADAERQGESGDCSICGDSCRCSALLFGRAL